MMRLQLVIFLFFFCFSSLQNIYFNPWQLQVVLLLMKKKILFPFEKHLRFHLMGVIVR